MSTNEKVEDIVRTLLELPQNQQISLADIREDLGADSLDMVEIIMKAEEAFNIFINDIDLEKITTVDSLVKMVERTIQQKP